MIDFLLGFVLGGGGNQKEAQHTPRQRTVQTAVAVVLLALVVTFLLIDA